MNEPRICIVGAGRLSSAKIYPNIGLAGGQIIGVCDLDEDKARRNSRRFGGTVYTDMGKMLDVQRPDGVIICVGPKAHAELSIAAMKRGYPVYTEKPPAMSAAEALAVARIASQTGKLCMTAFKKRYAVVYDDAQQWISRFPAADRYSISVDYASAGYEQARNLGPRPFLLDFAIHAIDLVGFLFGDVKRVFCLAKDDHAYAVSLEFACGAVGTMNLTDGRSFSIPTEEVEITLAGGNFMTIHNSSVYHVTENNKAAGWRRPPIFTSQGDSGKETGHGTELATFLKCLQDGTRPRSAIYESYKSMVLFEAIAESAAMRKLIEVKYEDV